jgi:hypothetical protein
MKNFYTRFVRIVLSGTATAVLFTAPLSAATKPASKKTAGTEKKQMTKEEQEVYAAMRKIHEVPIPVEERVRQMVMMAEKGDAFSVKVLKLLGDTPDSSGLQLAAINSLGHVRNPEEIKAVSEYLAKKWESPDIGVKCSGISGYALLNNAAAVTKIGDNLREYRTKKVEREELEQVRAVSVRALDQIGSTEAIKILQGEMNWLGRNMHESLLDYGSQLGQALNRVGTTETRATILVYLERLKANLPSNPGYKEMFDEKIAEAKTLAKVESKGAPKPKK